MNYSVYQRAPEYCVHETLLADILSPYKSYATYLKDAVIIDRTNETAFPPDEKKHLKALVTARGRFKIPEPCYIDDTGHFNSVEFNICFNQLAYVLMAQCLREKLLKKLASYSYNFYKEKQLSSMFIVNFFCQFRKPINAQRFWGDLSLTKISVRGHSIFIRAYCAFYDELNGFADGDVLLAFHDQKK